MTYRLNQLLFMGACSLLLACTQSCIKYNDFIPTEVPQGKKKQRPAAVLGTYMKSLYLYDEFATRALFDVLWMSDDMQRQYVHSYAERRGKSQEQHDAMLAERLKRNNQMQQFYLLADIRDRSQKELHDKDSGWSMYLQYTDGRKVQPISIKEVELSKEIQYFFGPRYTHFKTAYEVQFPVEDKHKVALPRELGAFSMVIAAPDYEGSIIWQQGSTTDDRAWHEDDCYWS